MRGADGWRPDGASFVFSAVLFRNFHLVNEKQDTISYLIYSYPLRDPNSCIVNENKILLLAMAYVVERGRCEDTYILYFYRRVQCVVICNI